MPWEREKGARRSYSTEHDVVSVPATVVLGGAHCCLLPPRLSRISFPFIPHGASHGHVLPTTRCLHTSYLPPVLYTSSPSLLVPCTTSPTIGDVRYIEINVLPLQEQGLRRGSRLRTATTLHRCDDEDMNAMGRQVLWHDPRTTTGTLCTTTTAGRLAVDALP
jgi:hypothetical protein